MHRLGSLPHGFHKENMLISAFECLYKYETRLINLPITSLCNHSPVVFIYREISSMFSKSGMSAIPFVSKSTNS